MHQQGKKKKQQNIFVEDMHTPRLIKCVHNPVVCHIPLAVTVLAESLHYMECFCSFQKVSCCLLWLVTYFQTGILMRHLSQSSLALIPTTEIVVDKSSSTAEDCAGVFLFCMLVKQPVNNAESG